MQEEKLCSFFLQKISEQNSSCKKEQRVTYTTAYIHVQHICNQPMEMQHRHKCYDTANCKYNL